MAKDKKDKPLSAAVGQKILSDLKKKVGSDKKDPTVKDAMAWLFDGNPEIILPHLLANRQYKLKPVVNGIIQKFRTNPRMLNFMNNMINDLYATHSESDILIFIKQYIQINRIQKSQMDFSWFPKSDREIFIEQFSKQFNSEVGTNDIIAHYDLLKTGLFNDEISKNIIKEVYKNSEVEAEEINVLNSQLEEFMVKEREAKIAADPRFIKELTPEVINEWSLSLMDIKTIEKTNNILLVFLDKNNMKKYYLMDFVYEFVISNLFSIIQNDYIMPFLKDYHQPYIINDFRTLENIKKVLREEKDKFYKQYGWIS